MKIPKKYIGVIIGAIVSTIISAAVSLFVTYQNLGMSDALLTQWLAAWWRIWPVAFIMAIVFTPPAKQFAEYVTTDDVK